MKFLSYPFLAVISIFFVLAAYIFAPIIALFVDANGNLPTLLKWFQTPDAPCWGAPFWKQKNPSYSTYKLCWTWLQRNPAQGWEQFCAIKVDANTPVTVHGNLDINDQIVGKGGWFFITGAGVFQFSAVVPVGTTYTLDCGLGWRLDPIAKKYSTTTLGALMFTPIRLHKI